MAMSQALFVLKKAIEIDLKVILILNKIDKPAANASRTLSLVEDLFLDLGASEKQLAFPIIYIIYASGVNGQTGFKPDQLKDNLFDFLDTVVEFVPAPKVLRNNSFLNPLQILILNLKYDPYKGKMGVGKITSGFIEKNMSVQIIKENSVIKGKISAIMVFDGLGISEVEKTEAGEIVMIAGLENIGIGDTIKLNLTKLCLESE